MNNIFGASYFETFFCLIIENSKKSVRGSRKTCETIKLYNLFQTGISLTSLAPAAANLNETSLMSK